MLEVRVGSDLLCPAIQIRVVSSETNSVGGWICQFDPLLRYLANIHVNVIPLIPIPEADLLANSLSHNVSLVKVSRPPISHKVREMYAYDDKHYGSFTDPVQDFWSTIRLTPDTAPPGFMFQQHYVRHRNFRGQASVSVHDLSVGNVENDYFSDIHLSFAQYNTNYIINLDSAGNPDYSVLGGHTVYNILPMFESLRFWEYVEYEYPVSGTNVKGLISHFEFSNLGSLKFSYDSDIEYYVGATRYFHSYHFSYDSHEISILSPGSGPNTTISLGTAPSSFGITGHVSNDGVEGSYQWTSAVPSAGFVVGIPLDTQVDDVTEYQFNKRLNDIALPFWKDVEDNLFDITAFSRDTATSALSSLASQAYDPSFGRIKALNQMKSAGDSIAAKALDAAVGDLHRVTLKKIMGLGGGAGLVRYRTIFSDCLQLINSIEVLRSLRNEPSKFYVGSSVRDYPILLGKRDCVLRVRTKAYLHLSPFRLLQILIGKQAITILNDLLALYYTSIPLGEILLTLLQLRTIGDLVSSRMFYDLPLFFVHSYQVDTPLLGDDTDYTGISAIPGTKVWMTYYIRDVSQHLPVLRFSKLGTFYGTGDVGNIVWSLLQQLAGVLSGGN